MTKLDWDKAKRQTPQPYRKSDAEFKVELKKLKAKPTAKQLAYLRNLGVRRKPETRAEASELIDKALA